GSWSPARMSGRRSRTEPRLCACSRRASSSARRRSRRRPSPPTGRARLARESAASASVPTTFRRGASPTLGSTSPCISSLPSPPAPPPSRARRRSRRAGRRAPQRGAAKEARGDVVTATVGSLLAEGTARLAAAGLECAAQDARRLLGVGLGLDELALYLEPWRPVEPEPTARFRGVAGGRVPHEPVQHLLGYEEFRGFRIAVTPDVLIPRPETEGLVERALELLAEREDPLVADIGTGSGAIACALAMARPDLEMLAVDQSLGALAVATDNVRRLGLASRVRLLAGDLFGPLASLGGSLDMVIANPPYLPSRIIPTLPVEVEHFEPHLALDPA